MGISHAFESALYLPESCEGFLSGDIKKAKEAGYHTCESLFMNTRKVSPLASQRGLVQAPAFAIVGRGRLRYVTRSV